MFNYRESVDWNDVPLVSMDALCASVVERCRRGWRLLALFGVPSPAGTEVVCILADASSRLLDAVRALPENYRNAVYLHYYEGYTAAEVGRMLGAPTNTVLSWLRRARAQLHTMLKEEIEDEVV